MFSIFNKKPFLKDLIPAGYVDIHSHLLPGIDDGAKAFDDTRTLISGLKEIGFTQFVTTPHVIEHVWENSRQSIEALQVQTSADLQQANLDVPLRAAAEYMLDGNVPSLLAKKNLLTLAGNHRVVEMSYLSPPIQLYDIMFEIQLAGYTPVLAHPERYTFYHSNFAEYQKLKNSGCKFQVNLLSAVGYYGSNVTDCAAKLLRIGLIDFAGSDVHHEKHLASFENRMMIKDSDALRRAMENNRELQIKHD